MMTDEEKAIWAGDPLTQKFFKDLAALIREIETGVADGSAMRSGDVTETGARYGMAVNYLNGKREIIEEVYPEWRKEL